MAAGRLAQDVIDAVPPLRKKRTVIFIKNGTCQEKLLLPPTAIDVTLIGEEHMVHIENRIGRFRQYTVSTVRTR